MDTKQCTKCKETREITAFHKNPKQADGLSSQCNVCKKEYDKANSARIAAYQKEYRLANREKATGYHREWRIANKEKEAAYKKEYQKANPDKLNAKNAKRNAAKLQRTPKWLTADDFALIESYYTQAKRLEEATGVKYHVDHIIPMQGDLVSGLHVPSNLQVITAEENVRKNNTFVVE
jgi:hypothetical protein